jgi:uncharacterized protein
MRFEMFKRNDKTFGFRLSDQEGNLIFLSACYEGKGILRDHLDEVIRNLEYRSGIELKETPEGKHYFNVKSIGGEIIGTSTKFETPELRDQWLETYQKNRYEVLIMDNN